LQFFIITTVLKEYLPVIDLDLFSIIRSNSFAKYMNGTIFCQAVSFFRYDLTNLKLDKTALKERKTLL